MTAPALVFSFFFFAGVQDVPLCKYVAPPSPVGKRRPPPHEILPPFFFAPKLAHKKFVALWSTVRLRSLGCGSLRRYKYWAFLLAVAPGHVLSF